MNWYAYEAVANEKRLSAYMWIDEAGRGPLAGPVLLPQLFCPKVL